MASKSPNHRLNLPPLELKCMKALWALGGGTVHEIRSKLLSERSFAYTTVLTLMDRLARKGIVEREKRGRAHLYRPLVDEDRVLQEALSRLVGDFFQGSRERLRRYLKRAAAGHDAAPNPQGSEGTRSVAARRSELSMPGSGHPVLAALPDGSIDPSLL